MRPAAGLISGGSAGGGHQHRQLTTVLVPEYGTASSFTGGQPKACVNGDHKKARSGAILAGFIVSLSKCYHDGPRSHPNLVLIQACAGPSYLLAGRKPAFTAPFFNYVITDRGVFAVILMKGRQLFLVACLAGLICRLVTVRSGSAL